MLGKYYLKVRNKRVIYNLEFKRSITIIRGNSGSGKTTLLRMLAQYLSDGITSGIKVDTDIVNIRVLNNDDACKYAIVSDLSNTIFFADEDVDFVLTDEFSNYLKSSGNWLVLITRSELTGFLQYSVNEIYHLESIKKDNYYLNRMHKSYEDTRTDVTPDVILTEYSKSGLDIVSRIMNCIVDTSGGKDN